MLLALTSPLSFQPWVVYSFPRAATKNDHKLGSLKQQTLLRSQSRSQKVKLMVSAGTHSFQKL